MSIVWYSYVDHESRSSPQLYGTEALDKHHESSASALIIVPLPDKLTTYSDYVHNLETLVVYVSTEALESTSALRAAGAGAKCASVSRRSNALFHPAVHFECPGALLLRSLWLSAPSHTCTPHFSFLVS